MKQLTMVGRCAITGVAATLLMDISSLLWAALGIRGLDPPLFAKWVDALCAGRLVSENLASAPPSTRPVALGLVLHYGIGVTLATAFVFVLRRGSTAARPFIAGIGFGVATSIFSLLVMFPSMGFGVLGLHPPEGLHLLSASLLRHAAYGLGLGLAAHFWLIRRVSAEQTSGC